MQWYNGERRDAAGVATDAGSIDALVGICFAHEFDSLDVIVEVEV
jgi:hypothetical protein